MSKRKVHHRKARQTRPVRSKLTLLEKVHIFQQPVQDSSGCIFDCIALKVYMETLPTIFMLIYIVLIFATLFFYIEPRDNIESYSKAYTFLVPLNTVFIWLPDCLVVVLSFLPFLSLSLCIPPGTHLSPSFYMHTLYVSLLV